MANIFQSSTAASAFAIMASDAITITRRVAAGGRAFTVTTVYSGAGDLQEGGGSTYYNPAGAVEVSDAMLVVSAETAAALPAVEVGDVVTRTSDGKTFTVVSTAWRTNFLPHLELKLKRGGVPMVQK